MPKTKVEEIKSRIMPNIVEEEEKAVDPDLILGDELIPGEAVTEEEDDEEGAVLDQDEVDPFKDKWEE